MAVADSKRGGRWGGRPPIGSIFFQKPPVSVLKVYRSLCAFAINEDGADKLSSAPFSKFLDPPLGNGECEKSGKVRCEVRGRKNRGTSCTKNYFRP